MKSCTYNTVIAVNRGFNGYLLEFIEERYKFRHKRRGICPKRLKDTERKV